MNAHGKTVGYASTNGHAFARNGSVLTVAELTADWTCKKRDGKKVPFDVTKIKTALKKCFWSVQPDATDADAVELQIENISRKVVATIAAKIKSKRLTPEDLDVETVQQHVIQQLWAEDLIPFAEHYQNYRESRRLARVNRPISPEVADRVREDQKHFKTDLQYYQFMSKFSRWLEEEKRRETWKEAVYNRICPWLFNLPLVRGKVSEQEMKWLSDAVYDLKASPAMRVVQMAGPALNRCNVGAYNCAYAPVDDLFSFPEALYVLMQGTGHGFSVENNYVSELPRIKKQKGKKPETIVVPDETEGWCNSYFKALQLWFDGYDVVFDTSNVRREGTRLKTKGGRASGPRPFEDLMQYARNMILAKQGRYLDDSDCHRLMCKTGQIVQVGGVRRAATISLSDIESLAMRGIKHGQWWATDPYGLDGRHLSMANNSAVYDYDGPVPVEIFMDEWLALVKSKSGERGIFNRQAALRHSPKRRKWGKIQPGCNPCAEILLRPRQFCNLSIAVARPDDTLETLKDKVRIATIFGVMQSTATDFRYIGDEWRKNCEEERLLGVDVTGHADCPLIRVGSPDREYVVAELKKVVAETRREWARRFGINESAADTTIKPGGDSAVFFDCASGLSPWFADQQIRWIRESKTSPISKFLIDQGVPYADAPEDPKSLNVFAFPRQAPVGATKRNDLTAVQQFDNWLFWKRVWAEHSVSTTIYADEHEWPELGGKVYNHISEITGVAFLPRDNGTYKYAPNEELTKEQFAEFMSTFPKIDWSRYPAYETEDMTEGAQTFACVGDKC